MNESVNDAIADLIAQGTQSRREGRSDEALQAYTAAATACREFAVGELLPEALTGLARIERDMGDLNSALLHYGEVEEIRRTLGETVELAHVRRRMADVLRLRRSYEKAEQAYLEAITIYRAHEEQCSLDLANTLRGLALLAESRDCVAAALGHWREAGLLYERVGIQAGVDESMNQVRILSEI